MPFQLTLNEGTFLVKLAREAVETYLKNGKTLTMPANVPQKLKERCGVFVTINKANHEKKTLRGCIGLPYPTTMLAQAVIESAISSATRDPRFPSLSLRELSHVVFEVSVLTPPQQIKVQDSKEYSSKIKVGRDGLIVERSFRKGLLLPQVPVEWKWDEETFLCQCCIKAGLPPDSWLLADTKIYAFQAIIFEEKAPNGEVMLKEIGGKTYDS